MSWWRRLGDRMRWDGTRGPPQSANAASSLHLIWEAPAGEWIGAEAVLEVTKPPTVAALYFWALQVSFADRGRGAGGAHAGLQWYPPHPGSTAVNWGGYAPDGRELTGSESALPSATGNPNTRDFAWRPRTPYRLRVVRVDGAEGRRWAWRADATALDTGVVTRIRDLVVPGSTLHGPMVWSEVFADCDAPSVSVRWSDLAMLDAAGRRRPVRTVRVNYQTVADGGCSQTSSGVDGDGFVQSTNTRRHNAPGTRLTLD